MAISTQLRSSLSSQFLSHSTSTLHRTFNAAVRLCIWVLHIAIVGEFFSPSLPNKKWLILGPSPFFFYQKSFKSIF